jgi:AAA ATPase domain
MNRASRGIRDLPPGPARELLDMFRRLLDASQVRVGQAAERSGLGVPHVSAVLRGWRAPSPAAAEKIVRALGGDRDEIRRAADLAEQVAEISAYERAARAGAPADPDGVAAAVLDFGTLIAERTAGFVGRRGPMARLESLLGQPGTQSAYVVISGEPGIGKTALLARLVQQQGLVHHFNSVLTGITSGEAFLRNVCAQLILKYRLPYPRLPKDAAADSTLLLTLLGEAARQRRVVVAVDAIDEAAGARRLHNRLFLPPALPPGAFMVVTARDADGIELYVDERRDLPMEEDDPENIADVREYIAEFLRRHDAMMPGRLAALGVGAPDLAAALTDRSEGNFMYLRHVLQAIRDGTLSVAGSDVLGGLPRGLQAYYAHLERQLADAAGPGAGPGVDAGRQLAILAVLAAWPVPLTAARIARFAGEQPGVTRQVLRGWVPFLNTSTAGGPAMYALYHASFRDFLAGRLDMGQVRSRIAAAIEDDLP